MCVCVSNLFQTLCSFCSCVCQIIHVDSALQVDNSREISEFDEEAQAAIQRASYDHRMKMQGLPTSSDKV